MSEHVGGAPKADASASVTRPVALLVLAGLLTLEAVAVWAVTAWQVVLLLTERAASEAGAVVLVVMSVIAALWVSAIAFNVLRQRGWVRGAALTWQIVQVAVGVGLLQGRDANVGEGLALVIPSILVAVLLFTPAVVARTTRPNDRP